MHGFLLVLLNILIIVGIAVLALMVFDIAFVISFNMIFKKHQKAIVLLLNVKCDNVKNLYSYITDNDIEIDDKLIPILRETLADYNNVTVINDLEDPGSEVFENSMSNLTFLSNGLISILNRKKLLKDNQELKLIVENINASDKQFRSIVTMYNADCLGYNYWISFLPTRFIWKLMKFKRRNLIEL